MSVGFIIGWKIKNTVGWIWKYCYAVILIYFLNILNIRIRRSIVEEINQITIYIKKWTGTERAKFITKIQGIYAEGDTGKPKDIESLFDFQTEVVAMSLYGEDGQPLYDSKNPEDIIEVGQIEADLLQKLFAECAGRNGLVEGKAKEDIRNLEIGQS